MSFLVCFFVFFFKQKTAYDIGLGIPAEPLFRSRFCNNLDPKRDSHITKRPTSNLNPDSYRDQTSNYTACIGFDGTRKTKEHDDFNRDWPNIIVADNDTIGAVDAKWNDLNIGKFIP